MPYVPSEKTVPPAEDRKILDPVIDALAHKIAGEVQQNQELSKIYRTAFLNIANDLRILLTGNGQPGNIGPETDLAKTIYEVQKKYGYWGAHSGELNYSITRLVQRVPKIKVKNGEWKESDELRYWLYAATVSALTYAAEEVRDLGIDADGVFEDVKDEYKWRVDRSYEAWQIVKSGDCYDTPYYSRLIEVVDDFGRFVGYAEVYLKRSQGTVDKDVLDYRLVLEKKLPSQ